MARFVARARRLPGASDAVAVGLALPAIVDADGRVSWAASLGTGLGGHGRPRAVLEAGFGVPASVSFDGYAATAGEAVFGGGAGSRSS